ncbi:MAG: M28 family peptidase [Bacteroidetes bacterium]|nr:M28 family peptidase [Bacteroidota bacterium]
MPRFSLLLLVFLTGQTAFAQSNFVFTNPAAEQVLQGNYDPSNYAASEVIDDPAVIASDLSARISPDSLKAYITRLSTFGNRNSASDTVSTTRGIGAARRWVVSKFDEFSAESEHRLLTGYFQFDRVMCAVGQHRNMLAVLPGSDPNPNGVVLVEAHIDSRCEVLCDTSCLAEGVEDNASGTALVMELARVMAKYTFRNTIVFMVVIGEEQGLYGAEAFAVYCKNNSIPLRAVLNNDVIGGVICGHTSSPPSCSGYNSIDSTSVRLFSAGSFNSPHKQLSRFIKLEYTENLKTTQAVPMNIRIMSPEDRTGRGGDHIPFRSRSFTAMRFTAANEHGDAGVDDPAYDDRQHSYRDVLGVDTDADGAVDSFFVQFNYLARNTLINGNAIAMAARGVPTPTAFTATRFNGVLSVHIDEPAVPDTYRVAVRSTTNDWDSVYTITGAVAGDFQVAAPGIWYVSVAKVDNLGIESLFSIEKTVIVSGTSEPATEAEKPIQLLQNKPNPFDEATWIGVWVEEMPAYKNAGILIHDLQGKLVQELPLQLKPGLNEVMYTHGYGVRGTFAYSLVLDGVVVETRRMVFAN